MPKYVIGRDVPNVGSWTPEEAEAVSAQSNAVLAGTPGAQWQESNVTDNKLYCVYVAPGEESIREHARRGGIPRKQGIRSQTRATRRAAAGDPKERACQGG
jgi:hypothetical protein